MELIILRMLLTSAVAFSTFTGVAGMTHRRSPQYSLDDTPSLRLLGVEVPVYKFRGEDAELECRYDRGSDPLYSVQWYKDDMEFFRFMFRNKPPIKVFSAPGVNVDENRSDARRIVLQNLTFESTGSYRCEVSADAPHFRTYTNQSRMVVVELPKNPPSIRGAKSHYRVGETTWLNCTSAKSYPVAQLTWFINGEKADDRSLRYHPKWVHKDGLETIRLDLVFTVRASHFFKGDMALKCQATVSTIYSGTNEQDAQIVMEPIILEQKENRIFVRSGESTSGLSLQLLIVTLFVPWVNLLNASWVTHTRLNLSSPRL